MAEQQAKVAAGTHGRGRARHLGQIRYKTALKNCIYDVLRTRPGWVEVKDDGAWDFYWCEVGWLRDNFDQNYFEEHVKICHFRNHYELTRKNLMVRNLKRYRKQLERVVGKDGQARMDFFPTTYELPSEYHMFVEEFKRNPGSIWIMKPISKSQGKGIFLFRKLKDIENWKKADYNSMYKDDRVAEARHEPETYIVSRYIANPYLISGKKFDLRVYALVTSYVPLKAWLYRSGFARFSGARYRLDTIEDSYVHLTNVAIQKTAPDYDPEKARQHHLSPLFYNYRHVTPTTIQRTKTHNCRPTRGASGDCRSSVTSLLPNTAKTRLILFTERLTTSSSEVWRACRRSSSTTSTALKYMDSTS
eukprot:scpid77029/ scgid2560/ Probable tubulin polyglutamylase TTLL9; Tubulin--tyrosine ligase-like protein 9